MKNIIKIIKLSEDLGVLLDGVTETIRHEIKKTRSRIFWALLAHLTASILQLLISSVVKGMSGRGVRKSEKAGIFSFALSFKQCQDYQLFQLRT